jgi:hypothetical protein
MHDQEDKPVPSQGDSLDGRYSAATLLAEPTAGYYTAMLTINKVEAKDSETKNKLVVKNDLGTTEYHFTIGLGKKPDPPVAPETDPEQIMKPDDGAPQSGPIIAIVIVAIIIIVVVVITAIARNKGMLCFADKNDGEGGEKSAGQFEALEKGEGSPEKEAKDNDAGFQNETLPEPEIKVNPQTVTDAEEKKSNGSHTPV